MTEIQNARYAWVLVIGIWSFEFVSDFAPVEFVKGRASDFHHVRATLNGKLKCYLESNSST